MDDLAKQINNHSHYSDDGLANGADDFDKDEPYETYVENGIRYVNIQEGSWETRYKFVDGEMIELNDVPF